MGNYVGFFGCLCGLCPGCGRLVIFVVLSGGLLVWVVAFSYVFRRGTVHFLFVLVGLLGSAPVAWVGMWASGPGFYIFGWFVLVVCLSFGWGSAVC